MSRTAQQIGETEIGRFSENLLRLEIVCNSLQAFASDSGAGYDIAGEARSLARFLREELPALMADNETILATAADRKRSADYGAVAALEIMREDHQRLNSLANCVVGALRSIRERPRVADREKLRRAVSAYLAAQRSHLGWSRKILPEGHTSRAP